MPSVDILTKLVKHEISLELAVRSIYIYKYPQLPIGYAGAKGV